MPNFDHVVEIEYQPTFRTEKIVGMFDVPVKNKISKKWKVDLPIEEKDWNIGLIVGASGAGKTTIAKEAFKNSVYFEGHKWSKTAFVNDFEKGLDIKVITDALSSVGFSSPPSWLLPYNCLSHGQQFRADLARSILETKDTLVFDEFTSLVDRTVAKIGSYAVAKFVRKQQRKLVAVTCHYDVAEWLEPDWVYDVSTMQFSRRLLRRPPIKITIQRVHHSAWRIFKGHHYLSADLNKASRVYVAFIESQPVALTAILPFPHPYVKNMWKEHRTVVLPDYQGIGLGSTISEHIGDLLLKEKKRYTSVSSHPAMIHHRAKSNKWTMTRSPSRSAKATTGVLAGTDSSKRLTAAFEYIYKKPIKVKTND